jgi:hypothetical protein
LGPVTGVCDAGKQRLVAVTALESRPKEDRNMKGTQAAALVISFGGLGCAGCGTTITQAPTPAPLPAPGGPEGSPKQAGTDARGRPTPRPTARIVAYTWEPTPPGADRLVYALKVDRRNYDVQQVAAALQAMRPGHRAIRLWKWADPELARHPDDRCRGPAESLTDFWYPEPRAGIELVRSRWVSFLQQLRATGAPLDEVILGYEGSYGMWGMDDGHPAVIMADPRWQGITSYEAGELIDISHIRDYQRRPDYLLWNAATHRIVDRALQRAIYEPLRDVYPSCRCSNFGSYRMQRKYVVPTITGAHPQWYESDGFGTHEGPVAYGRLTPSTAEHIMRNGEPLGMSPYAAFLYTTKRIEAVEASTIRPFRVWVCSRNMAAPKPRPVKGTPYNDEILRHMLVRRYGLILWNANMGGNGQEMMQTNAVIEDAASHIGESGRALPGRTEWSDTVVHAATTGPDRVVHRFTFEFPDQPIRYRINDVVYERCPEEGEVGLWVTHAREDDFELLDGDDRIVRPYFD